MEKSSIRSEIIAKIIYTPTYLDQRRYMDNLEVNKLEQAIEVHGYRGASKCKHNGVVLIKPEDSQLWKSLTKFKKIDDTFLSESVKLNDEIFYSDVKIVAHCPNGNRAIGSLYKNHTGELTLYVIGFSNYCYQLF